MLKNKRKEVIAIQDLKEKILSQFSTLSEIYPSIPFSELYLKIIDRVLENLCTKTFSDEDLSKALQFCIDVPQFLFHETWFNGSNDYYIFRDGEETYKLNSKDFYGFRYSKNKRGKNLFKFTPIWEEYKNFDDIIKKCPQSLNLLPY